jgi:hypothetical protein
MPSGVYKKSEEHRKKISDKMKIIATNLNRDYLHNKKSKETKLKMSLASKGKKKTASHIMKMSISAIGKHSKDKCNFWKGGKTLEKYPVEWTATLRKSIRERDRYICRLCFKQQEDISYSVHHIDYNKDNLNPENLITLCKQCHQKTNFDRDKWTKYFNLIN